MRPIRSAAGDASKSPRQILKAKACNACRIRKVKCDRALPCSNCLVWSQDCTFPSPIRRCHRPSRKSITQLKRKDCPVSLEKALESLEKILKDLEPAAENLRGQPSELVHDASRLVVTGREVDTARLQAVHARIGALIRRDDQDEIPTNASQMASIISGVGKHSLPTRTNLSARTSLWFDRMPSSENASLLQVRHSYLSRAQIHMCWQTFQNCIDPLVKVLHCPSVEELMQEAIRDPKALTGGEQALLLAICFSSLCSMTPVESEKNFHMPRHIAMETYRLAIDQALSRADVLTTDNLTTLQALVLYLSFVRLTGELKKTWALIGIAKRIESLMDADQTAFVVEMHRRLWWQLWYLDHRATEDPGQGAPTRDTLSTPDMPLNINDNEINPNASDFPSNRTGWTGMSFGLIRFDIARTSLRVQDDLPETEKDRLIDDCKARIYTTYLQDVYCKDEVYWLGQHVSHVLIMEMSFKLHHDRLKAGDMRPQPRQMRDELFFASIDIVDAPRKFQAEPQAARWLWLLRAYLQFLPLRFLLEELCHRQVSNAVDFAWEVAECAAQRWTEDMKSSKNGKILMGLMEQARSRQRDSGVSNKEEQIPALLEGPTFTDSDLTIDPMLTQTMTQTICMHGTSGELMSNLTQEEFPWAGLAIEYSTDMTSFWDGVS